MFQLNTVMAIHSFARFIANDNQLSEVDLDRVVDETGLFETTILNEKFSPAVVKAAAIGIVAKMAQLRQRILQDRTADNTEKSLSTMVFLLASMLAVAIGGMGGDSEVANRAKGSISR